MPSLNGSGHVVLLVADLARSIEWYREVFGFVVIRDGVEAGGFRFSSLLHPESHAFVGLADLDSGRALPFDPHRSGVQHYGFHVAAKEDLAHWATHLDNLGIEHTGLIREGYGHAIRFEDPDGIVLEVFWADVRRLGYMLARAVAGFTGPA